MFKLHSHFAAESILNIPSTTGYDEVMLLANVPPMNLNVLSASHKTMCSRACTIQ